MLEVVTAATNTKLTTVAAVKAELGIAEADTSQDALLGSFVDQASGAIVDHCSRPFARESYRETLPGYGGPRLVLSRTPIVEVTSIVSDSELIVDYVLEDRDAGFLYRRAGWRWTAALGWRVTGHPIPGSEEAKFTVEYSAGYVLPEDGTTESPRTLPQAVERACIEAAKCWYLGRDRDPALASERFGDLQSNYVQIQGLPPIAVQLLIPWRRVM